MQKKPIKLLFVLGITLLSSLYCFCSDTELKLPDESSEVLIQVIYRDIVRKDVLAYSTKSEVYLPLLEILNELKIYYEFDFDAKIIKGYINTADSSFTFDFTKGKGAFSGRVVEIREQYAMDNLEIYATSSFISTLLNIKCKLEKLQLMVIIDSPSPLPVLNDIIRTRLYDRKKNGSQSNFYDLIYGRLRNIINGGMFSYTLNMNQFNNNRLYYLNSALACELLSGDFNINSISSYNEKSRSFNYMNTYRWRMELNLKPWLTNISIGDLNTSLPGFTSYSMYVFKGIQITNTNPNKSTFFTDLNYTKKVEKGSKVEIYKNNILLDHTTSDSNGIVAFYVPLEYGANQIEFMYYGTRGQFESEKENLLIPIDLLTPGEIIYSLNAGQKIGSNSYFINGRATLGFTDWITNSLSVSKEFLHKTPDIFNTFSLLPFNNILAGLDISPGKLYGIRLNYHTNSFGSYMMSFIDYPEISDLNLSGSKYTTSLTFNFPKIDFLPLTLNGFYQRMVYDNFTYNYFFSNMIFYLGRFSISNFYNLNYRQFNSEKHGYLFQYLTSNLSYNWFNKYNFLSFIKNIDFNIAINFDITNQKLQTTRIGIGQTLFDNLFCNISLEKSPGSAANIYFGLKYDLNFCHYTCNLNSTSDRTSFNQQIQGGFDYMSGLGSFKATNNNIVSVCGISGANIRLYQDLNNNDKFDEGEPVIPNVRIDIPQSIISYISNGYIVQAGNLVPYKQYNVSINVESIENPILKPKWTNFSFIADPNNYKMIDVPCYATGIIEGSIARMYGDKKQSQSGVKIHIENNDSSYHSTSSVFSDGSFFIMGVKPGKYRVYIDPAQLKILNVRSEPDFVEFSLLTKPEGDYININFTLYSK